MAHGLSSADVPAAKKLLRAAHTPFTPPRAGNEEQMHGLSKATRDEEHSVLIELSPACENCDRARTIDAAASQHADAARPCRSQLKSTAWPCTAPPGPARPSG